MTNDIILRSFCDTIKKWVQKHCRITVVSALGKINNDVMGRAIYISSGAILSMTIWVLLLKQQLIKG